MKSEIEKIDGLRQEIDAYDRQIVDLLNKRAQCADRIGVIKRRIGLPVYVPSREEQVIAHVQSFNPGPLSADAISRLYERIIDESRRLEQDNFHKRNTT